MLWISTNKGLGNYNIKTNFLSAFTHLMVFKAMNFLKMQLEKSPNGTMFFGGSQGVNMFQPDSIYDNPIAPNLEIQKIVYYINNQKVTIAINNKKYIRIPWQNNTVSIHFAALEFTQPYKIIINI
jgi:hypothetical protein